MTASLPSCERLEVLHLEGNNIESLKQLEPLLELAPRLKQLCLQNEEKKLTNPSIRISLAELSLNAVPLVCKSSGYPERVAQLFPALVVLDEMRLKSEFSFYKLGLELENTKEKPKEAGPPNEKPIFDKFPLDLTEVESFEDAVSNLRGWGEITSTMPTYSGLQIR